MKKLFKLFAAFAFAAGALGVSAAMASHDGRYERRPQHCAIDHDHRSHTANYYDYYPADRYSRAGAYRGSGVQISVRVGERGYRRDRRHRYYNDYGYGARYREGRPVHREIYDTRLRARIVLVERIDYTRRGPRLVCTVSARGPQARYAPYGHLRRIAARECSRRAEIRILA